MRRVTQIISFLLVLPAGRNFTKERSLPKARIQYSYPLYSEETEGKEEGKVTKEEGKVKNATYVELP